MLVHLGFTYTVEGNKHHAVHVMKTVLLQQQGLMQQQ